MPVGLMFALKMLDITSKGDNKNHGGGGWLCVFFRHSCGSDNKARGADRLSGSVPQKDGHRCMFASFWLENLV